MARGNNKPSSVLKATELPVPVSAPKALPPELEKFKPEIAEPNGDYLAVASLERDIQKDKVETVGAFFKDGRKMSERISQNEAGRVVIPDEVSDMLKANPGSILTHNHPKSTSFSPADINTMCRCKLGEIRIVSEHATYSLRDPSGAFIERLNKIGADAEAKSPGGTRGKFAMLTEIEGLLRACFSSDKAAAANDFFVNNPGKYVDAYTYKMSDLVLREFAQNNGLIYTKKELT